MKSELHQTRTSHRQLLPIVLAVAVFASLSVWQAIASEGFLEADGCTHYMYARWAFNYPVYFVDIWGRPFKTLLYAPAAATVGLIGVRLTSLAVAISISFIAYAIAKGQRYRWPALALIFTLAQPLLFLHSFSELTELPFAMLLGLAFLAYQRQKWWTLAILAGLLPLSRPEGFGFVLLTAGLLACHRKWWLVPVLLFPVMGWQIAGAIMYREPENWWNWLPKHWPYAGDSLYPKGPIWHFAGLLPAVVGPALFPFVLIGFWRGRIANHPMCTHEGSTRLGGASSPHESTEPSTTTGSFHSRPGSVGMTVTRFFRLHAFRIELLIAAVPLMIFVGHSVLYALGKMASNGELRYMLIVAPFWGLLAARGWEWVWERFVLPPSPGTPGKGRGEGSYAKDEGGGMKDEGGAPDPSILPHPPSLGWRSPFRYAALAAIAPVFANLGYKVLPLVQTEDWKTAARIAEWYKTSGVANEYPYIMAAHPGVVYALDVAMLDPRIREWNRQNIDHDRNGTIVVWDSMYGHFNANSEKSVSNIPQNAGWLSLATDVPIDAPGGPGASTAVNAFPRWMLWVSDRRADSQQTPRHARSHAEVADRDVATAVNGVPEGFTPRK